MLTRTAYRMKPPQAARLVSGHPLARDLVLDMSLREGSGVTAFDAGGRRRDGTLTGGATWTMGKYGRAIDVDGTDGHVEIADHSDFTPALHPFSFAAQIYMHNSKSFKIASKYYGVNNGEWDFSTSSINTLVILFCDQSEELCWIGRQYNVSIAAHENQWVRVVFTYDGGTSSAGVKLYLNGVRCDDLNYQSNPTNFAAVEDTTQPVRIGRSVEGYADGLVGSVRIWRRVLTLSDIQLLHCRPFCMYDKRRSVSVGVA